ncbi:MAG: hypothetical protein H0V72_27660 [Bradyrhizobium sp.]|nr:hypothetical protein [Bradyrhizobium sp.]
MRLTAILSLVVLAGCSSTEVELPAIVVPEIAAPSHPSATIGAQKAANEAKLVGPVDFSAVRMAYPLGPGPYFLCIRGTNAQAGTRHYAVFFKNNDYIALRSPVMIDECETQAYTPLGSSPFPIDTNKPKS